MFWLFHQTWGEAYEQNSSVSALYNFRSFATYEHEIQVDGYLSSHQHSNFLQNIFTATKNNNTFGIDLPSAVEHPLFYIGVYAIIGLSIALAGVVSVVAQYTGALRASRILFRWVLSRCPSCHRAEERSLGSSWKLSFGLHSGSMIRRPKVRTLSVPSYHSQRWHYILQAVCSTVLERLVLLVDRC